MNPLRMTGPNQVVVDMYCQIIETGEIVFYHQYRNWLTITNNILVYRTDSQLKTELLTYLFLQPKSIQVDKLVSIYTFSSKVI